MSKHLFPRKTSRSEPFQKPPAGGGTPKIPEREREAHGQLILAAIADISRKVEELPQRPASDSVYLEFQGEPGAPLALGSIESVSDGRELVAVRTEKTPEGEVITATVLANPKKLGKLAGKVEDYLKKSKKDKPDEPRNKDLVNSISAIRFAPLQSILVGTRRVRNVDDVEQWEAWLRVGNHEDERNEIIETFRAAARASDLRVGETAINFPESSVVLISASFRQINETIFPLNLLAELRPAAVTAAFFIDLDRAEQIDWNDDAADRVRLADGDVPAVCILDTGVNNGHRLIRPALDDVDLHAYNPNWLVTDHHSHGTGMAGLCLYGDLVEMLQGGGNINLTHRLESVKILPPNGVNPHDLYGSITKECVARAEITAPQRKRVICLAVTSTTDRNSGMPSSWSAAIDNLAAAADEEDGPRRLFFIAAGNTDQKGYGNYPVSNHTDQIHDPAQSWNAVTVGAYTEKDLIPADSADANAGVVAPYGLLSPHSTTSRPWKDMWPSKPDVVMEGGNLGIVGNGFPELGSLRLLTTYYKPLIRPFHDFGSTSASTALASRFGAMILAEYPHIWPETVRALLIHSAEWTEEMIAEAAGDKSHLLECYGFGVPNLKRALESSRNSLTLIVQDQLQPFKEENGARRANEMNLHELPWARDILLELGEIQAEMKVTLSYFIEPNPSSKGFSSKHKYASHQLQFATMRSEEDREGFRKRVNLVSRQQGGPPESTEGDSSGWFLKPKLRTKGSIHSDVWSGTSAQLATKNLIAVYPVGGWWKDLKREQRWNSIARYSLIVSIKTEAQDIDIYTPIQNQIENVIEIEN